MMEVVEKRRLKGGFFGLFDWHSKSKKKLFANTAASNEQLSRGREVGDNSVKSRCLLMTEVDGFGSNLRYKRSSDFSSSSSVTSDDGCGNKAPGVVARLMGLDSLPTPNLVELYSTPVFEPSSFGASYHERSLPNVWSDNQPGDYHLLSNKEGPSWNTAESRLRKVQNQPFERFQTEVLPQKSAKPISITHHKLLSPIKCPGFIPTNNAAYIIEAAAKIIESSPQASRNNRVPSFGSSSVPLRIRDLKEKLEAAHRTARPQINRQPISCKEKSNDRSRNCSAYLPAVKASTDSDKRSPERSRVKTKSVPLAVQSKSNVQRREGAMSSNTRNSTNQERNRVILNQNIGSEPNVQKTEHKRTSANRNSNVLRQNNYKQNSVSSKDKSASKASVLVQPTRKSNSANGSAARPRTNKTAKKVVMNSDLGSGLTCLASTDTLLELSSSKQRNSSRRKRPVAGDYPSGEVAADNVITHKVERSIKSETSVNRARCNRRSSDDNNKGMDIVSFMFTSPIKKSAPECHSSDQEVEAAGNDSLSMDSSADNSHSQIRESELSSASNMINGDALSTLLEQKLKELADKVESSSCNLVNTENSVFSAYSKTTELSTSHAVSSSLREDINVKGFELDLPINVSDCMDNESCLTSQSQELLEMDVCSTGSTNAETGKYIGQCHPGLLANQHCSGAVGDCSIKRQIMEGDELENYISKITDTKTHCNWELEYARNIFNSAELMLEDGLAQAVLSQDLFNQFENQEGGTERYGGDYMKITRKVLFDCISECLNTRCGQSYMGSSNSWYKWSTLYREGLLADELYKEILSWVSMEDLMVDELLDKDMSSRHGRWLDFDLEAFEEGVQIEQEILNNLVKELVTDLHS